MRHIHPQSLPPVPSGAIGVMLGDTGTPARLYRFFGMLSTAIGQFAPLDNPDTITHADIWDFWPLIDALP